MTAPNTFVPMRALQSAAITATRPGVHPLSHVTVTSIAIMCGPTKCQVLRARAHARAGANTGQTRAHSSVS